MKVTLPYQHVSLAPPFDAYMLHYPEAAASIDTHLSEYELRFLFGLARDRASGRGVIVDTNAALGASAVCLAVGLQSNVGGVADKAGPAKPIVVLDRGTMPENLPGTTPDRAAFRKGDATFPELEKNLAPMGSQVDLRIADGRQFRSITSPVELLHLSSLDTVVRLSSCHLFPHLIPGVSVVVQHDYFAARRGFAKAVQLAFADKFALVGEIGSSAVFLCTGAIDSGDAQARTQQARSREQFLEGTRTAAARTADRDRRLAMTLWSLLLVAELEGPDAVRAGLDGVERECRAVPAEPERFAPLERLLEAGRFLAESPCDEAARGRAQRIMRGEERRPKRAGWLGPGRAVPARAGFVEATLGASARALFAALPFARGRSGARSGSACLVCIARNEGPYIVEWLAHHLALGFDEIIVYDHRSTDDTSRLVERVGADFPVSVIPIRSTLPLLCRPQRGNNLRRLLGHWSPQSLAYNHALGSVGSRHEWIAFFDCDEFLVLHRHETVAAFLAGIDDEAGAVGINWLCFGSGGKLHRDEQLVTRAFRRAAPSDWFYNCNFKTIARAKDVLYMSVNRCVLRSGEYRSASNEKLSFHRNTSSAVDHTVAQLNHYQVKSRAEWEQKVQRGRATKHEWVRKRRWTDPEHRFQLFDRNEFESRAIDRHWATVLPVYQAMQQAVGDLAAQGTGQRWRS